MQCRWIVSLTAIMRSTPIFNWSLQHPLIPPTTPPQPPPPAAPRPTPRNHFRIPRRAIVTVNLPYRCRRFPNSRSTPAQHPKQPVDPPSHNDSVTSPPRRPLQYLRNSGKSRNPRGPWMLSCTGFVQRTRQVPAAARSDRRRNPNWTGRWFAPIHQSKSKFRSELHSQPTHSPNV